MVFGTVLIKNVTRVAFSPDCRPYGRLKCKSCDVMCMCGAISLPVVWCWWVRTRAVKKYKDSTKPNARVRFSVEELEKAAFSINVTSGLSPLANEELCEIIGRTAR